MNVAETIEREFKLILGWCTVEKGVRMFELARGADLCVELGVFGGRGLVAMSLALAEQKSGFACGIDPYSPGASLEGTNDPANDEWWKSLDYEAIARVAQLHLCRLGLIPYAQLIRLLSREVVGFYEDDSIDVLHQDSNHSEEISTEEVTLWAPKLRRGGYWIFDDTDWSTTQKAQWMLEKAGFVQLEDNKTWKVYRKP